MLPTKIGYTLGRERYESLPDSPGFFMRIDREVRKTVVFIGYPDPTSETNIRVQGTGFLLLYKEHLHLVTAGHVASLFDVDCAVRINRKDGSAITIVGDSVKWHFHPDPAVDLATAIFNIRDEWGCDFALMKPEVILANDNLISLGDLCYTVGMFRVMVGKNRNLPVVHTGNLARMAGEEPIPQKDPTAPGGARFVDGYLVESQSLTGLSGAPVFIRESSRLGITANEKGIPFPTPKIVTVYADNIYLLGVWVAAWEAPAGQVMVNDRGREMTVPVGMGVVVPARRIPEVLDLPELEAHREKNRKKKAEEMGATPQSILIDRPVSPPATDANPNHREDFTRLVGAAARKREQED
jgi:hypothetical protein